MEPAKPAKQVSFGTMEVQNRGEPISLSDVAQHVPVTSTLSQQSKPDGEANVWESLFEAPIQVKLGQLLWLVPNFHKALLSGEGQTTQGPHQANQEAQITFADPVLEEPVYGYSNSGNCGSVQRHGDRECPLLTGEQE